MSDALLTTAQAADALGVSVKRVYQLIAAGRLPAERETVAGDALDGVRAAELARFAALERPARRPTNAEREANAKLRQSAKLPA